jgi:hypothetical protein
LLVICKAQDPPLTLKAYEFELIPAKVKGLIHKETDTEPLLNMLKGIVVKSILEDQSTTDFTENGTSCKRNTERGVVQTKGAWNSSDKAQGAAQTQLTCHP